MGFKTGQMDFKQDIKTGEQGEAYIRAFLEGLEFTFLGECKNSAYDLKMAYKGKEYTYEIKTDTYARDTGNMAIEYESRGKASGISVTQADYFTYFFPNLGEIWNIKVSDLRQLILDTKPYETIGGDKGSNTKIYLLKKKDVEKHFNLHRV